MVNVPRRIVLDTATSGLYGSAFAGASEERVRAAVRVLDPPTLSHICAMEAPKFGSGEYTLSQLSGILCTAHTAFSAVRHVSAMHLEARPVIVHTGAWGCGAYGGSIAVMALMQFIAAWTAGVPELTFHAFTQAQLETVEAAVGMVNAFAAECPVPKVGQVLQRIAEKGYRWGITDGN
jgi:hypothetical protein